jgi:hypothetical protein
MSADVPLVSRMRDRMAELEHARREQRERRDAAAAVAQEAATALLQIEGALAVLRSLVNGDGAAGEGGG